MAENRNDVFATLNAINVNEHTEQKDTGRVKLTYLSWVWAWAEVRKRYPDASYLVERNPDTGLPYWYDPNVGIMVYTSVMIQGETHEMWLPVMDGANNAMRFTPYEITTKYGTKPVAAATMMDVNKAVMRCLAKNLAMFGLGLYIYAGEDLPEGEEAPDEAPKKATAVSDKASKEMIEILAQRYTGDNLTKLLNANNISKLEDIPAAKAAEIIRKLSGGSK